MAKHVFAFDSIRVKSFYGNNDMTKATQIYNEESNPHVAWWSSSYVKIEQPREDNLCTWFLLFIEMALILASSIFFS